MKTLIVVDMQKDFIDGSLGTKEAAAIVPNVKKKIENAIQNGDMIIYTRDTHFENYLETREGKKLPVEHCIYSTDGWRIPDELLTHASYENTCVIDKYTFGSWELPTMLRKMFVEDEKMFDCNEIELIGLCTDICVVSNALLLKAEFYNELEITVDASCCAGVTPESHKAALLTMKMCQINVIGE